MVREEDVKLMSRIAIYEKREGRTEIPVNNYYKGDYIRWNALKAAVSATVVFLVVGVLTVLYKMDYLLANVLKLDYKRIGIMVGVIYACWVLLYWIVARILYAVRYEKVRPHIIIYNHRLKKLLEARQKEVVKPKGGVVVSDDFINF